MNQGDCTRLSELGVATVYEAFGRQGLIDLPLIQLIAGSREAGPARTALCAQDDNLMVHAVIEQIQPGEILVLSMPEPRPIALIGELLATQVKVRQAAAILVDAAVRDVDELIKLGLPVWARYIRVKGASKLTPGDLNVPVSVGGTRISPGDILVLDGDGCVCVPYRQVSDVLAAAEARFEKETRLREKLLAGETSYDLHGLRDYVKQLSRSPNDTPRTDS
jgi:4-hydroxy-4-methyl-2-oxoglutarate aldolase